MYIRESTILKGEVGVIYCFDSLQSLLYVLTRGLSNVFETASLITSSSTYGVKSIGLTVIGSYPVNMEANAKLNAGYIKTNPTLLEKLENLINPD